MATYIIGDVHGCYDPLRLLLDKISFDSQQDQLCFVGDLVNRGPQSAEVLRFVMKLPRAEVVLGNHDLHLLALYYGVVSRPKSHPLQLLVQQPGIDEAIEWLCQQQFMHLDLERQFAIVHAGLPPQWTVTQACSYARELEVVLGLDQRLAYLQNMYGDAPNQWSDDLMGWDRLRYITNALTRMRFCNKDGVLDLSNKGMHAVQADYRPWFEWFSAPVLLFFGHWAALKGASTNPHCVAMDTGCVWGNTLSAYRVDDHQCFSVAGLNPAGL